MTSWWHQNFSSQATFHKHMLPTVDAFLIRWWIPEARRRSSLKEGRKQEENMKNSISRQHKKGTFAPLAPGLKEQEKRCLPSSPLLWRPWPRKSPIRIFSAISLYQRQLFIAERHKKSAPESSKTYKRPPATLWGNALSHRPNQFPWLS